MENLTAEQIYMQVQEKYPMHFGCYTLPEDWQIEAMDTYSDLKNKELIAQIKIQEQRIDILRRALDRAGAKEIKTHDGSELNNHIMDTEIYGSCHTCQNQGVMHCAHPEECGASKCYPRSLRDMVESDYTHGVKLSQTAEKTYEMGKAYAEQAIQEVLKRAAENAEVKTQLKKRGKWVTVKGEYEFDPTNFEMKNSVNKRSILNTEYKDLLK